jgi:hypothetical protein
VGAVPASRGGSLRFFDTSGGSFIFLSFFPPFLYASDSAGLQKQVFGYLFDFGEPPGMQLNSLDWPVVLRSSLPRDSSCLSKKKGRAVAALWGSISSTSILSGCENSPACAAKEFGAWNVRVSGNFLGWGLTGVTA